MVAQVDWLVTMSIPLWVLAFLSAVGGVLFAWNRYVHHGLAYDARLQKSFGGLYRLWQGKYFVDEAYERTVVQPLLRGSRDGLLPIDQRVIDGIVNGFAHVSRGLGSVLRYMQTGVVQSYAVAIAFGVFLVVFLMLLV